MTNELKPVAYFLLNIDGTKDLVTVKEFENYCYGGGVMCAPEKEALYAIPAIPAIPEGYSLVKTQELESAFIYLDSFVDTEKHNRNICSNCGDVEIESPVDFTEAETALEHLKAAKESK